MDQQREYRYNNSLLRVRFCDIVEANTDVIVNSDDYLLPMADGLSAYLLEKGGPEIQNDVKKNNHAELGDVVVTTAGKLPHKFIFHCVTVSPNSHFKQVDEDKQEETRSQMEEYVIRHSVSKCFRLLSAMDLESIAIPCIGVRRAGFSFERIGKIMAEVISDFLLKTNKSYRVELCLWDIPERVGLIDYIAFFEQFSLRVPTKSEINHVPEPTIKKTTKEPLPASEFDVFVSYSHLDKEIAEQICSLLSKYGISHWIDHESVRRSDDFKEDIVDAICRSRILLFISSYNSNKSRNTVKEVGLAERKEKVILPVRVDDSSYNKSLEYDLCNRHWIQLKDPNDYEELGRQLNDNIRFYLNRK
ncbi:MAG: TIR domain-containing protein [Prevotella sp.]|nr:TIR domain-containing protein [Prevotella sp.]